MLYFGVRSHANHQRTEAVARCRSPKPAQEVLVEHGHTGLSARTWTSVTPLPVTHLHPRMPVRDGPPRYCGTGPAGSLPAGDGHELP